MTMIKEFLPKDAKKVGDSYFLNFLGESDCIYSGTYLGRDFDSEFIPSLALIEMASDKFGEIVLNKKNSWLFTCNRIITDCVLDKEPMKRIVVVRNGYNEILGIAKRVDTKFMPVWDVGHLLRRELNN